MKAFRVRGIVWQTGGKLPALPGEATVECESEEGIADALSDTYGWVVSDFVAVEEFDISGADRSGEF
ncbi:hypothetical protein EIQ06_00930 [Xanthomonas campestris pv. campestris]|jgi:hypothetical protein|uniref:Uncharacterized protein n=3 Tax=Xanthomonas TaxID=338 RepID=B0RUV0_XANCB|nr:MULTISPECIES: hypothetical protein [Xanthomonas]MCC4606825.1 hypothetical protein [Xanthomonas campestris pv. zinniae]APP77400.1 hypothetical protein BJD12_21695 [Xanthomonas vesicatoria ATCC 35937]EGD09985.1 hypothetical protein XVE_1626 [Xanthomonas vesicatoria ATCC 35937]KTF34608.1 hypothetical protein LMG920_05425 [Xanthomonas vesicatoria]MCC8595781.1 hypothetical protein [Xanthomonas vesicatoria]